VIDAETESTLRAAYRAFNERDVEAAIALMHPQVEWPNAWEGGCVIGREAVADYWRRQFEEISSKVEPERFVLEPDGSVTVVVRQIVHDAGSGALIADERVGHRHWIEDGLIVRMDTAPVAELDSRYSTEGATPVSWGEASTQLENAEVFWISTVRPDGRPHVTPLIAVWLDGALHFCTGPDERKAKNLDRNPKCILTTGTNAIDEGLDLVVEGEAVRVTDDARLRQIAEAYVSKYGEEWRFGVQDGNFVHGAAESSIAIVFEVSPQTALGFRKGNEFSQTRWRFNRD
jgi:nitroimidazol reductase NimA-like FMN-containing flavoprotein (pyridoxamine 5'-phosphate oxidase superfamily)/ketosteroid isomerase-like protein